MQSYVDASKKKTMVLCVSAVYVRAVGPICVFAMAVSIVDTCVAKLVCVLCVC